MVRETEPVLSSPLPVDINTIEMSDIKFFAKWFENIRVVMNLYFREQISKILSFEFTFWNDEEKIWFIWMSKEMRIEEF